MPDGDAEGRDDAKSLDERLAAAGMYTVAQMLGVTPLTRWTTHAAMDSLEFYETWLDRRAAEFLRMKARYELGDRDKGDELYEWVLAHGAAFQEARTNLKAALAAEAARAPAPEAWVVTNGEGGESLRYRMWGGRAWTWTRSADHAAHFARRGDAAQLLPDEEGHGWLVVPLAPRH